MQYQVMARMFSLFKFISILYFPKQKWYLRKCIQIYFSYWGFHQSGSFKNCETLTIIILNTSPESQPTSGSSCILFLPRHKRSTMWEQSKNNTSQTMEILNIKCYNAFNCSKILKLWWYACMLGLKSPMNLVGQIFKLTSTGLDTRFFFFCPEHPI